MTYSSTVTEAPLYRRTWAAPDLCFRFPPQFTLPHKVAILQKCCPDGAQTSGQIEVTRWNTMRPERLDSGAVAAPVIDGRQGGFRYEPAPPGEVHWWVNFAADELFHYYARRCFAQDEIQVFEHPILASVREALLAEGLSVRITDRDRPTPMLITGAHRRFHFETKTSFDKGSFGSLYGKGFHRAPLDVVLNAAHPIDPPTVSDILVIEAPAHGWGPYQRSDIEFSLIAAYTGFRAAMVEAGRRAPGAKCVIHTGFWGCGAYGGNHVLMAAVQLIAARLAGVDTLAFYEWDAKGREYLAKARKIAESIEKSIPELTLAKVVDDLLGRGFIWGQSDGN